MRLKSLTYEQYVGTDRHWRLDGLRLDTVNLIVGKNATGKSRTLNVINGLAQLVSGRKRASSLSTGTYKTVFEDQDKRIEYELEIIDHKVTREAFSTNGIAQLTREKEGAGTIWFEKENKLLEFQVNESECAVIARVDRIQHGFLTPLVEWGDGVRHYEFGTSMGRTTIAVLVPDGPPPDPTNTANVVALFLKGEKLFDKKLSERVTADMNAIGYSIETTGTMVPTDVAVVGPAAVPISTAALYVQETDLQGPTQQTDMSQGMFRSLSVLIHLHYAILAGTSSCVLIDDIGEGIDFERSVKLINVIRETARKNNVQLVLSTNDRFVMNEVPLEEWSLLQRRGGAVEVRNRYNAQQQFEDFKYIGMSNFSFFEMDFINSNEEVTSNAGS
jgi:energy-coupling factor transporter ATP-binding protein EcfA2